MRWNLQTRLLNTSLILAADMEPVEILKSLHNPKNAQVSPYLDMYGVNRWQTFLLYSFNFVGKNAILISIRGSIFRRNRAGCNAYQTEQIRVRWWFIWNVWHAANVYSLSILVGCHCYCTFSVLDEWNYNLSSLHMHVYIPLTIVTTSGTTKQQRASKWIHSLFGSNLWVSDATAVYSTGCEEGRAVGYSDCVFSKHKCQGRLLCGWKASTSHGNRGQLVFMCLQVQ